MGIEYALRQQRWREHNEEVRGEYNGEEERQEKEEIIFFKKLSESKHSGMQRCIPESF